MKESMSDFFGDPVTLSGWHFLVDEQVELGLKPMTQPA